MTPSPQKRSSREPFPIPVGVALLIVLFVAGVALVVTPQLTSGGWGGLWRVAQIGGFILAGVLVYRWLVGRARRRHETEDDGSTDPPKGE